ncbi:uncharacterized protein LOC144138456 isoform X2 [Haemaphysalis longicornis]
MNPRNLASLAAEVKEVGYSWMARGPLNTGPSVRCRSQPEVSTRHAGDEGDNVSVFSLPLWRALSPSPDSGVPSSTSWHQTTVAVPATHSSSFEGSCSQQHQGATPGAHFAGSSSESHTARAVDWLGGGSPDAFVEVCMTTIDPGTEASDLKKMLFNLSQEHEMVLHISLAVTPNGCFMAKVRVPSASDARLVMERLQQCQLGKCSVKLSLNEPFLAPPTKVTTEPLRCPLHHPPPSSSSSSTTLPSVEPSGESSRAQRADVPAPLPCICMPRARFAAHMERLLDTHSGSLPLDSFQWCYEAEFGPLPLAPDLEPWREGCVPLEHLVASLPGVTVVTSARGFKRAVRDSLEGPLPNGEYTSIVPSIALCLGLHAVLKHRNNQ